MNKNQKRLYELLETAFNPEGEIHFLAIAEKQIQIHEIERPVHQVRVALTFQEGDTVNPYYDGTDLFVTMGEDSIQFTLERDWADGPPAIEGSPTEFALGWVSELAEPFYVSPEALEAAKAKNHPRYGKPTLLKAIVRNVNERKTNQIKPIQDELTGVKARISKLEGSKRKHLGLYELDQIDQDLFADRLNDLNSDLDTELTRKAKLELELRDDQAGSISYELVRSLIERFDHLLQQAPFPQRKTLLHLVVKKISLDDKLQVQDVELIFNEETEKHFLSLAPSAESMAEGAFPIHRKGLKLKQSFCL